MKRKLELAPAPKLLKLDFGCGKNVREGFEGIDRIDFGQKHVIDVCKKSMFMDGLELPFERWRFEDGSVEEAHASHFIEHLEPAERIHFVNELYRVLIPNGKCQVIVPHWASCRAYGDLTHKWPPVSEFWFYYLSKEWREQNAPHNSEYTCDFNVTWGYSLHPAILNRNAEYQNDAVQWWKEAAQDMVAMFSKK